MKKPGGFWLALSARIAVGVLFILSAPKTRMPDTVHVLGILITAAAGILIYIGPKRFAALLDWWTGLDNFEIRVWCVFGVLFCVFLIFASGWPSLS